MTDDHYSIALWANEQPHPLYVRKYTTMRRSKTLEAAKAAAQADYEARILAAIQPDPEPQPVATSSKPEHVSTPSRAGTVSVEAAIDAVMQLPLDEKRFTNSWVNRADVITTLRALAGDTQNQS